MSAPDPGLYLGRTTHVRHRQARRRFSYRVFQLLLDPDRISATAAPLRLLAHNRPGLFAYYDKDHGDRTGAPLRPWAEAAFAQAGVSLDGGALRLLCFPRVLGYVFNPLSLIFGYGPDGAPRGVIYEVNNTFGETHAYVAPMNGRGAASQAAQKVFHVSPFLDIRGDYQFRVTPPEERLFVSVANVHAGACEHYAVLRAVRRPLSDLSLARAFLAQPLMTLKVIAMIHLEALKIVARGVRYRRRPALPGAEVTTATAQSLLRPAPFETVPAP